VPKATRLDFEGTPFLDTSHTGAYRDRLNWRAEILLTRNREVLEGKRVLDLASHDGRFSYACLKLGASRVVGIEEGRPHLIQSSNENLRKLGYPDGVFEFRQGDIFDRRATIPRGAFDTILCLGWLYHTVRQIELMREFQRLRPAHLILDTGVMPDVFQDPLVRTALRVRGWLQGRRRGSKPARSSDPYLGYLLLAKEDSALEGATIDSLNAIAYPTKSFVEFFLSQVATDYRELTWREQGIADWSTLSDHGDGTRVTYLAHKPPSGTG
jgi:hypothetical protein